MVVGLRLRTVGAESIISPPSVRRPCDITRAMPSLAELQTRRTFECRLEPQRALRSLEDAAEFLHDRGILTRTADSALPSLFGACHEPPFRPGRGGFAAWPATAYPWFSELAARDGVHELSVHGGKRVLVTRATAALADPICRAELAAAEAGEADPAQLLRHLASAGPSPLADLKVELEWDAARLRRARRPLERAGALVSRSVTLPAQRGGHTHSSVLARWDQAFPEPAAGIARRSPRGLRARGRARPAGGACALVLVAAAARRRARRAARRRGPAVAAGRGLDRRALALGPDRAQL